MQTLVHVQYVYICSIMLTYFEKSSLNDPVQEMVVLIAGYVWVSCEVAHDLINACITKEYSTHADLHTCTV